MKRKCTVVLAAMLTLASSTMWAEDVFVPGFFGSTGTSDVTPCPPQCHSGTEHWSLFGAGNASASQVNPAPVVPNNVRRIFYTGGSLMGAGNDPVTGVWWSASPTNITLIPASGVPAAGYTLTELQHIGVYKIYLTKGQNGNATTNLVLALTAEGGTLADTNGVGATQVLTGLFQRSLTNELHKWIFVAYLTNTTPNPVIKLTQHSGNIDNNTGAPGGATRWYMDAIRFEYLDQCAGVAPQVSVGGPLVQGQQFVNVRDVAQGAQTVTVYSQGNLVGQAQNPGGFPGGTVQVTTTSALNKGDVITAGQIKNGCASSVPATGPVVGSGPNSTVNAHAVFWRSTEFPGPVGSPAPAAMLTNTAYFLKADGFTANFGTAPNGGETLTPDGCWKTVVFDHAVDAKIAINGAVVPDITEPFVALEGLVFTLTGADSGPYDVYVDEIKNGDVVIEDFESYAAGAASSFAAPTGTTFPNPTATYLSEPNSSLVTTDKAFSGSKSLRIQWQWSDAESTRWAHILMNNTAGKVYPMIDVTKPVTIRYLVLPAGQSAANLSFTTVPANQTKGIGQSVTFTVTPAGSGPFTYEWSKDGTPTGDTGATLTKSGLQLGDTGVYSVKVTGGGCEAVLSAKLTVTEVVTPPTISYTVAAGKIKLTWAGSFKLEKTTTLGTGWAEVPGAVSGFEETMGAQPTFFRLVQ